MKKAISLGLPIVLVINKVDKPAADPAKALSKVEDLFLDLGASDDQMDFAVVYASGVNGISGYSADKLEQNLFTVLDTVIEKIPAPEIKSFEVSSDGQVIDTTSRDSNVENPLQLLVLNLQYDSFKGKLAAGKITSGYIKKNQELMLIGKDSNTKARAATIQIFDGLGIKEVEEARAGEIVMISGFSDVNIGDTITTADYAKALPRIDIDEPTIRMTFGVNTSPFSGKEGKLGTYRQIR